MNIDFFPDQKFLLAINFLHNNPLILIIPTLPKEDSYNENTARLDVSYVGALKQMFSEYYRERYTRENSQYLLVNMFHEPLRNAWEHGNRFDPNSKVVVGIWMGQKGVLFAFRDCGDYFSKKDSKVIYESRTLVSSTRAHDPGGFGCIELYEVAEDIVVATEENTLYASYLLRDPE